MKRVLNSGSIGLTAIHETYKEDVLIMCNEGRQDINLCNYILSEVIFEFEIKAPILILQSFQKARLGEIDLFEAIHASDSEIYLPPFFYKLDQTGFVQFDTATCNELYTKYSNFYRNVINFYYKLRDQGVCQSEAAMVLPLGLLSTFKMRVSGKALLDFITTEKDKSPELYGYCESFMIYLQENLPRTMACLQKSI